MKKITFKILSAILVAVLCLSFVGCREKEDCIPKVLGKSEGLYLYYGNYRSKTDGTEVEQLVSEITVDGITYTDEEFQIICLEYFTSTKEIVYNMVVEQNNEDENFYCAWHYNYDTKESGLIVKSDNEIFLQASNSYVYLKSDFDSGFYSTGKLFNSRLNLVQDGFRGDYRLYEDCLYILERNKLSWWKGGKFYEIKTTEKDNYKQRNFIGNDFSYLFYGNILILVDMNTGENKVHFFENEEKLSGQERLLLIKEKKYFITSSQITETDLEHFPLETGCKLWCLQGLDISLLHTFKETYEVEFEKYDERYLNFIFREFKKRWLCGNKTYKSNGYYDIEGNRFAKGVKPIKKAPKETFKIEKYEFYIDSTVYGALMSPDCCYYLHRITDGNDEILQYFFDETDGEILNPVLFEDIYTH